MSVRTGDQFRDEQGASDGAVPMSDGSPPHVSGATSASAAAGAGVGSASAQASNDINCA